MCFSLAVSLLAGSLVCDLIEISEVCHFFTFFMPMLFSFDLEDAIVTLISLDVETERFPFTVNVVSAVVPDIFAELSQVTVTALFVA